MFATCTGQCSYIVSCYTVDCCNLLDCWICAFMNRNFIGFQGRFENNNIHSNKLAGVWVKNFASPIFRQNEVHHGKDVGFFIFQDGQV